MFTLEQLNAIHDRLGAMEGFAPYVQALQALGVEKYDSYLADGRSEFIDSAPSSHHISNRVHHYIDT